MRKKTDSSTPASEIEAPTNEKPKTQRKTSSAKASASETATKTPRRAKTVEPTTVQPAPKARSAKKPAASNSAMPESSSESKTAAKQPRSSKAASKEDSPSVKPKGEPTKKPVAKRVSAKKPVEAPKPVELTVEDSKKSKKPAALLSLAELVEEDKKNPKPRVKKAPTAKQVKLPEPVAEAEQPHSEDERTHRSNNRRGGKPVKKGRTDAPREPRLNQRQNSRQNRPLRHSGELTSLEGLETEIFEQDLTVYWRSAPVQQARPESEEAIAPRKSKKKPEKENQAREPQRSQTRNERPERANSRDNRGRKPRTEGTMEDPETELQVMFRAPEPPKAVSKPLIPTPKDAPQVIMRNGVPTLVRDGRAYPPLAFFGSAADERRAQTVLGEVRRAAEAGIHIHSFLIDLDVDPKMTQSAIDYAAYMIVKALEVDSESQILLRVVFGTPKEWSNSFPDAVYTTEQGRIAEPSVCDPEFWDTAKACVTEFVTSLRKMEFGKSILGVHLDRGEWFFPEGYGYDNSKSATAAFRDWLRTRYANDIVAFRAAWFDGTVQFNTVHVPEYKHTRDESHAFIRTNRRDRRWVDYHLFLSDATVHRISELAYAVKEASEGYYLVGANYGYTFEWSHPASGHLGLGKLLRTNEIDFLAGPPSYRSREAGHDAPFPVPIDSLTLNGKLYFSEDDYKTAIGDTKEPDDYNPVIRTPQALEAVHWRGIGAALAHGSGAIWMDLWGNGWLNTSTIWERGAKAAQALITRMHTQPSDPDVAVFIDERALAYLVDQRSFAVLVQDVRESVLRSGLSAGFYLLSDLAHRENFPDCKVSIFLNAWDIRPEHRLAIKNRLQGNGKVLFWLYCAGMFDSGREALERAREVTGIAFKPQPFSSKTGTTILNRRHPLCEAFAEKGLIGGGLIDPSYFAIPEQAVVLGEYSASGLPSFVVREFDEGHDPAKKWTSVFLGEPFVTPGLLRGLAQLAGAHIWNFHSDVVHARPPFLTVHCTGTGPRAIALPRNWTAYDLLSGQWEAEDSSAIKFQGFDGATKVFLVGERHEIENILALDPESALKVEDLPERPDDSVRFDTMQFDVPLMRLDEFIEGVPDEVSDDWFLKPSMIESAATSEPESVNEERVGRRRRRDRRGSQNSQKAETGSSFDEDLGMNILFRKRD